MLKLSMVVQKQRLAMRHLIRSPCPSSPDCLMAQVGGLARPTRVVFMVIFIHIKQRGSKETALAPTGN